MKTFHSLMVAGLCALALCLPTTAGELRKGAETVADRVSWADLMAGTWFGPAHQSQKKRVEVIAIDIDPMAAKLPGAMAAVLPQYEAVIKAVRDVVAKDQVLSSSLKQEGFDVDDVLGVRRSANGAVSLFVGSSA